MFGSLLGGLAALGYVGGQLGLGAAGIASTRDASEAQTKEAARQFDANLAWQREQYERTQKWLTEMSNTAHQREVDDLIAAGLNPVLSATGGHGASSPSMTSPSSPGSTASAVMPDYGTMFSMMERGLSAAGEIGLKTADVYSRAALNESEAAKNLAVAAQTKEITQPMKENLLQQVKVNSSLATKHAAEANQINALTPKQVAKLTEEINLAATNNAYLRRQLPYVEAEARSRLASASSLRAYQNGVLNNMRARTMFEGVRTIGGLLYPARFFMQSGGRFQSGFPEFPQGIESRGIPQYRELPYGGFLKNY